MAGRKTKYTSDFLPVILDLYRQGKSDAYICAELDITRATFYDWYKNKKAFSDTVNKGRLLSQQWWENLGQSLSLGVRADKDGKEKPSKGNGRVYMFNMINRFKDDWQSAPEKQVTESNLEALRETITSALGEVTK